MIMKLLDEYLKIQKQIYNYFGYIGDWVVIPIDDARNYFWYLTDCEVYFADTEKELWEQTGNCYVNTISFYSFYTQRPLPKWIYRGKDYTMVCVDTHTDGNKFLQIFDNSKERPEE